MEHRRNPHFTGRKEIIEKLANALTAKKNAALSALSGMGGVGKTQIAVEYAYLYKGDYEIVWWLRAEESKTLATDYAGMYEKLGLSGTTEQAQQIEQVKSQLEHTAGWLLIFDNAVRPADIDPYLPKADHGHIIVTSREHGWQGMAEPMDVTLFTEDEAVEYILNYTKSVDRDGARKIAGRLGRLPLALAQAAAYIAQTHGTTFAEYISLLDKYGLRIFSDAPTLDDYKHTVETTWQISFERVQKECPPALDVLRVCAFLSPDRIPLPIFPAGAEFLPDIKDHLEDERNFKKVIRAIEKYSLAEIRDGHLNIHRLVQEVVREKLSEEDKKKALDAALKIVNRAWPTGQDDLFKHLDIYRELTPHVLALWTLCKKYGLATIEPGRMLNGVALYYKAIANYDYTIELMIDAMEIAKKVHGEESGNYSSSLNNLAMICKDLGDLPKAKELTERALKIGEKSFGPDHPNVAINLSNLATVYKDLGDLPKAKELAERALTIDEKSFGPDHPNVAIGLSNLATIYRDLGDLPKAKELNERALTIGEKKFGPDHPSVAIRLSNIATIYQGLGDLPKAKELTERALTKFEKNLGANHPNVATLLNNLATIYKGLGNIQTAREYATRALAIFKKSLPPGHPYNKGTEQFLKSLKG